MIVHVVLFRPKAGLVAADRASLVAAIDRAHCEIPAIRRFVVGKRTHRQAGYAATMPEYPFIAVIEVANETALREYLEHPAHVELARLFWETSDSALAYDFDVMNPSETSAFLNPEP